LRDWPWRQTQFTKYKYVRERTLMDCAKREANKADVRLSAGRHGGTVAEHSLQAIGRLLRSRSRCVCVGRQYQSTCEEQIVECKSSPVGVLPFPTCIPYRSCETCFAFTPMKQHRALLHPRHRCAVFYEDIQTPDFVNGLADLLFRTSTWVTVLSVVPFRYDQQACTDTLFRPPTTSVV
jgi:hypothetical protein